MAHHCCSKQKVKRGLWSPEEDEKLIKYITAHGLDSWSSVAKLAACNNNNNKKQLLPPMFLLNSQMKDNNNPSVEAMNLKSPFLVDNNIFPNSLSLHEISNLPNVMTTSHEFQNPNIFWATEGENHPQNVPAVSSSPLNLSGFGLIDENCMWNNETTMEIQPQPQNEIYEVEIEKPNGQNNNMSTSFDRSYFDFDFDFVESNGNALWNV
ncbi:hypothetical protein Pint_11772 [Pistacia integerrima]|uniref:Uncharacterized protein n=1 Tax=Pistacia integerrima TaxID=434235 RepID=A0ACC0XMB1_9ROSI|nr:hypothetical protein Pint_11772 [Pistacia integerrima]